MLPHKLNFWMNAHSEAAASDERVPSVIAPVHAYLFDLTKHQ